MSKIGAVTETSWSGVPALRLEEQTAGSKAMIAPTLGGNLFSLEIDGREVLRRPPDADALKREPSRWGVPVLMPPNRIAGARFTFNNREYRLEANTPEGHHIHGFPLRRPWRVEKTDVTDHGAVRVVLQFSAADHPDVLEQFPHPFVLTLTYTLEGKSLRCDSHIANNGDTPMPFGLGFHPYLSAPEPENFGEDDRWAVRLSPALAWESEDKIPTGRFYEPEGAYDLRDWQPLHAVRRDGGYKLTAPDADGWSRFQLKDKRTGRLTTLRADSNYTHWVIFNGFPGFCGFISPEPYTCMTNAFNLQHLPAETTGMKVIAPRTAQPAGTWILELE